MLQVGRLDAFRDCSDQGIILLVLPTGKIIAVQPSDIGELLVAVPKVLTVGGSGCRAVLAEHGQPTGCLDGIEEHEDAIFCCKRDDMVEASEVGFVGGGEIVMSVICAPGKQFGKRSNAVGSLRMHVTRIVAAGTRHVDPPMVLKP